MQDLVLIAIALSFECFIIGALLLVVWSRLSEGLAPARYFATGFLVAGTGWFFIGFGERVPPLVLLLITNFCFFLAPFLQMAGTVVRCGHPVPWRLIMLLVAITATIHSWLFVIDASDLTKILFMYTFTFFAHGTAGFIALMSKRDRYANSALAVGMFSVSLVAVYLIVAGILAGDEAQYEFDDFHGFIAFLILTISLITEGVTCVGALLLDAIYEVRRQAFTDPLTQCLNRRGFDYRANNQIERADLNHGGLFIMIADLDHFKRVNDSFGHAIGDQVLVEFAKVLLSEVSPRDLVGRFGGEEFVVLLNTHDKAEVNDYVLRVKAALKDVTIPDVPPCFKLTSSYGATNITPEDGNDLTAIIRRADDALYRAKNEGRDCLRVAICSDVTDVNHWQPDELPQQQPAA